VPGWRFLHMAPTRAQSIQVGCLPVHQWAPRSKLLPSVIPILWSNFPNTESEKPSLLLRNDRPQTGWSTHFVRIMDSTDLSNGNMVAGAVPQARFTSVSDPENDPHVNGSYFAKNPTWHVEYSAWKANNIFRFLKRKNLHPKVIGEVGCGAGEVLKQLQSRMGPDVRFWGWDVIPPAIEMAKTRENERLHFSLADFEAIETPPFGLAAGTGSCRSRGALSRIHADA
jgi:hypothetical protein